MASIQGPANKMRPQAGGGGETQAVPKQGWAGLGRKGRWGSEGQSTHSKMEGFPVIPSSLLPLFKGSSSVQESNFVNNQSQKWSPPKKHGYASCLLVHKA